MSAFIVDYKTLDNILSIRLNNEIMTNYCYLRSSFEALTGVQDWDIYDGLEKLGQEFLKLNIESVNCRYPNSEEVSLEYAEYYKFNCINNAPLGQAIKSLDCLMYQSCEIDNFKENETYKKMSKLRECLVDAFLNLNDEYKLAEWDDSY